MRGTAAAPSAGAAQVGAPSAQDGADDFSAALAQSLAATPTDTTASADPGAAKGSNASGTEDPSEPAAKHSAADPLSSALMLLENALAAALGGAMAGVPSAGPAAAADGTSSQTVAGPVAADDRGPRNCASIASETAALIDGSLAQNLSLDPNAAAGPSNSPAVTPAAAATAAAAALTAAQLTGSPVTSPLTQPHSTAMAVSSPVGSSAWPDELGAKVTWLAHQGIESASLQLSPEHLGPLQVSISVHNGQASVWFGAAQPDTRAALQQSLPQLRQLFANQGLTLSDAGVSRESPRGQAGQTRARAAAPVSGVTAVTREGSTERVSVAVGLGLVDTYV